MVWNTILKHIKYDSSVYMDRKSWAEPICMICMTPYAFSKLFMKCVSIYQVTEILLYW